MFGGSEHEAGGRADAISLAIVQLFACWSLADGAVHYGVDESHSNADRGPDSPTWSWEVPAPPNVHHAP